MTAPLAAALVALSLASACLLAALLGCLHALREARRQLEDHAWLANATPAQRPRRQPPSPSGEAVIACGRCGWEGRQSSLEERRCPACGAAFMRVVA